MTRVPWTHEEDEEILLTHAHANGGFPSFRMQAEALNRKYHEGKPIRTSSSTRNRESYLLSGGKDRVTSFKNL